MLDLVGAEQVHWQRSVHSAGVCLGSIKDEQGQECKLSGGIWNIIWCCLRQSTKSTREAVLLR